MKKTTNIAAITQYILLFLGVVFALLMFFGGSEGDANNTPAYTDATLRYTYILIGLGIGLTLLFEIINLILNPSNARKSLISIAILTVIIGASYLLSDGVKLDIIGYSGTENIASMLILTDTGLYTAYILIGILILSIIGTEIFKWFK